MDGSLWAWIESARQHLRQYDSPPEDPLPPIEDNWRLAIDALIILGRGFLITTIIMAILVVVF